jgi:hypothetical protein
MSRPGRHRAPARPRTGARAAVIAGLAVTAPLVGMTSAEASTPTAPAANWGAIAMCESGGQNVHTAISPGVNTASGYFQITNGTWRGAGGTEFAPTAMQATKAEQLVVAKRIAAARGSLADWSSSRNCWAGASKGSMNLDGSAAQAPAKVASAAKAAAKVPAKVPAKVAATPKAAAPKPTPPTGQVATGRGLPQVPDGYVIQAGDTLATLAFQWKVPGGYPALAAANGIANPDKIYAGSRLA